MKKGSPILRCSRAERLALCACAVSQTRALAKGAGLTGGTCVWYLAFTYPTLACALTVAQHAVARHTCSCVHGAGAVVIGPAVITQAPATRALPSPSTHSFM